MPPFINVLSSFMGFSKKYFQGTTFLRTGLRLNWPPPIKFKALGASKGIVQGLKPVETKFLGYQGLEKTILFQLQYRKLTIKNF